MFQSFTKEWKGHFKDSLCVALLVASTFCLLTPLALYLSNVSEYWFSLKQVLPSYLMGFLLCFLVLSVLLMLFKGKGNRIAVAIAFGIGLGFYIQANWIGISYGVLDGEAINWSQYHGYGFMNTAIWLLCLLIPLAFLYWKKTRGSFHLIVRYLSLFFIALQLVGVGSQLFTVSWDKDGTQQYLTDKDINTYSTQENIILLVVDMFEGDYLNNVLEESPEYGELLDDFVYYKNTSGMFPRTKAALPHLLTGKPYDNSVPFTQYLESAYKGSSIITGLKEKGYHINFYTSPMFVPANAERYVGNVQGGQIQVNSHLGLLIKNYQLSAYRCMPHFLKPFFWFYSGDFDSYKKNETANGDAVYSLSNLGFYQRLQQRHIFDTETKQYKVIHIDGTHLPFVWDENLEIHAEGTSESQTTKAVLKLIHMWLTQLKEAGVYENSTILILGDHGANQLRQNPVLLYKQAFQTAPFEISNAPVSYADIEPTLLKALGLDIADAETISDIGETDDRKRFYYDFSWNNQWDTDYIPDMYEYEIGLDVKDESQLVQTGVVYSDKHRVELRKQPTDTFIDAPYLDTLNWDLRGTGITLNHAGTSVTIQAQATVADVDSSDVEVYWSFLDLETREETICSTDQADVLGTRDIHGMKNDKLYRMSGFIFEIPLDFLQKAAYQITIYTKFDGKIYKACWQPLLVYDRERQSLQLIDKDTVFRTEHSIGQYQTGYDLTQGNVVEERFQLDVGTISEIKTRVITWNALYRDGAVMTIQLIDDKTQAVLFDTQVPLNKIGDNALLKVKTGDLAVEPGNWYRICYTADTDDDRLSLAFTDQFRSERSGAVINGEKTDLDVAVIINGH